MTTNQQTSDSEGLRRVEEKLDRLIDGLPRTYATQLETDRRFTAIEAIIKVIQGQIDGWGAVYRQEMKWAETEHKAMNSAVIDAERRIMAELKDNTKTTKSSRLAIWLCVGGWILTIALFIIGIIIAHVRW